MMLAGTLAAGPFPFASFDVPDATTFYVYGISNTGYVVGSYFNLDPGVSPAYIRNPDGSFVQPLNDPADTTDSPRTRAFGINAAGVVVGDSFAPSGFEQGFLYDGSFTTYTVPGALKTTVFGINDHGDIVGQVVPPPCCIANDAFIQIGADPLVILNLSADLTVARGINNLGYVVGTFFDTQNRGFIRAPDGSITVIDFPGSVSTTLTGINDFGVIVGDYRTADDVLLRHGFYGTPGNLISFDIDGPETAPGGINNLGQIAGTYTDGEGAIHGFVTDATVPEPGTLEALLLGLGSLAAIRRFRRQPASSTSIRPSSRTMRVAASRCPPKRTWL